MIIRIWCLLYDNLLYSEGSGLDENIHPLCGQKLFLGMLCQLSAS